MQPETICWYCTMCNIESFKIDLKALPQGQSSYEFKLNDEYFKAIDALDVRRGELSSSLSVERMGDIFELKFHIEGVVCIACDLCLEDMELPICCDNRFVAKFGKDYSDEDGDLVVVPEDEGILDVAWHIYEFIVLQIPIRHVHAAGKCNPVMIEILKGHSAVHGEEDRQPVVDSRWETLLRLKNKENKEN